MGDPATVIDQYRRYVQDGRLSALLFIRSSDTFLGLPFNIASVALLTHMLAQQADLGVADIVISLGDAHIYSNHSEQVNTQLSRTPGPLPQLQILRRPDSLFEYCYEDFSLTGYEPQAHISAPVAI